MAAKLGKKLEETYFQGGELGVEGWELKVEG
jgi:hypothetical protein